MPSSLSTVKRLNLARLRMSRRRLPGENTTLGLRIMTALKVYLSDGQTVECKDGILGDILRVVEIKE